MRLLAVLLLAGCNAAGGATSYLQLDRDARAAGLSVELAGWRGAPMLPLELRAGEPVTLLGAGAARPLALEAGRLVRVRGADGVIERGDVDEDRLIVEGDAAAVRALATLMSAEVVGRDDGRSELHATDLLGRGSFLTVPEGITDVEASLRVIDRAAFVAPAPSGPTAVVVGADEAAAHVGLYRAGARVLLLDAGGRFELGDQRGTWRVDGDRLIAAPDFADSAAFLLTIDGDALHADDGSTFVPFIGGCP